MNERHIPLVQEVIDVAGSGVLLSGNPGFHDDDVFIEYDFEAAQDHAGVQFVYGEESDEPLYEEHYPWEDVLETESGRVHALDANPDREKYYQIRDECDKYTKALADVFSVPERFEDARQHVWTDFELMVEARVFDGDTNPFFEKMLYLYRNGLWPCGWKGKYPEGKFRAFNPAGPGEQTREG